jgi:hypothetical protein
MVHLATLGRANASRRRRRPAVNTDPQTWKACWVHALASSNLASSATLACRNTQDERRQDCLDVKICLSFVSVPDHEMFFLAGPRRCDGRVSAAVSPDHRHPGPGLNGEAHARESCARIAAGPRRGRSACARNARDDWQTGVHEGSVDRSVGGHRDGGVPAGARRAGYGHRRAEVPSGIGGTGKADAAAADPLRVYIAARGGRLLDFGAVARAASADVRHRAGLRLDGRWRRVRCQRRVSRLGPLGAVVQACVAVTVKNVSATATAVDRRPPANIYDAR